MNSSHTQQKLNFPFKRCYVKLLLFSKAYLAYEHIFVNRILEKYTVGNDEIKNMTKHFEAAQGLCKNKNRFHNNI